MTRVRQAGVVLVTVAMLLWPVGAVADVPGSSVESPAVTGSPDSTGVAVDWRNSEMATPQHAEVDSGVTRPATGNGSGDVDPASPSGDTPSDDPPDDPWIDAGTSLNDDSTGVEASESGLEAYFSLDSDTATNEVTATNATAVSNPQTGVDGIRNNGWAFTQNDTRDTVADAIVTENLPLNGEEATVGAWVNFTDHEDFGRIYQVGGSTDTYPGEAGWDVEFAGDNNRLQVVGWSGGGFFRTPGIPVEPNTWYYVVTVIDGDNIRLHVFDENGELDESPVSDTGARAQSDGEPLILMAADGSDTVGRMDEVHAYSRAPSESEIKELLTSAPNVSIPRFEVSDLQAPENATEGDTITVNATISNVGDGAGTTDAEFVFDGDVLLNQTVSLDAGASQNVSFDVDTHGILASTYEYGVRAGDSFATAAIDIEDSPTTFEVSDLRAPANATAGEFIGVNATVSNVGDVEGTVRAEFVFDGKVLGTTAVTIGAGNSTEVTFDVPTTGVEPGTYEHGVQAGEGSQFAEITLAIADEFQTILDGREDPEGPKEVDLSQFLGKNALQLTFEDFDKSDGLGARLDSIEIMANGEPIASLGPGVGVDEEFLINETGSDATQSFNIRFADADAFFTYQFIIPEGAENLTATVDVNNEFLVSARAASAPVFEVSNLQAPASAVQGDNITVNATVSNVGEAPGTTDAEFVFDGHVLLNETLSLDDGNSANVSFELPIDDIPADTYEHGVRAGDNFATATIGIELPTTFEVSNLQAPASAVRGEIVTVNATISNVGDAEGTVNAEFVLGGDELLTETVTLSAGNAMNVSFEVPTVSITPDTYEHGVRAGESSQFAEITIECSAELEAAIAPEYYDYLEEDQDAPGELPRDRVSVELDLTEYAATGVIQLRFEDYWPSDGWGALVDRAVVRANGTVIHDVEATTEAEQDYIVEDNGSDGTTFGWRFADKDAYWVYGFDVPEDADNLTVTLEIANGFRVLARGAEPDGSGPFDPDPPALPGNGTTDDPYVITNASELREVPDDLNASYVLGSDINASETAQWNNESGFDPIGNDSHRFAGRFDGAGHTITGLTIDRPGTEHVGLFGYIDAGGQVGNLTVANATIAGASKVGGLAAMNDGTIQNTSSSGAVNGSNFVGGLVGKNSGSIRTATATAVVNGVEFVGVLVGDNRGTIRDASAAGSANGSFPVGGLVGGSNGIIRNTSASTTVTGSLDVGGLVGGNFGTIRNASATGPVNGTEHVGGLTGLNVGSVRDASATGAVNGSKQAGGLVGLNDKGDIKHTWASGQVSGSSQLGGLVGANNNGSVQESYWDLNTTGQATSDGGTGLTSAQMTGEAARTNMSGLAFGTVWETQPGGYPVLVALAPGPGEAGDDIGTLSGSDAVGQPGRTATVTFNATNIGEVDRGYIVRLSAVPENFTVANRTDDGGLWDGDDGWLFKTITPGASKHPAVTFNVPANASGTYTVEAELLSNGSIVDTARVNVSTTVSVGRAIDANGNGRIGDFEILEAIRLWRTGATVPGTGGKTIGDFKVLDLISTWREGASVGS